MKCLRIAKGLAVLSACAGLLFSGPSVEAAGPEVGLKTKRTLMVADVALDAGGGLRGTVVDRQGAPQPGAEVALIPQKQATPGQTGGPPRDQGSAESEKTAKEKSLRVKTDQAGRFRFAGLTGGLYLLHTGGQARVVRAWTSGAAPPAAKESTLLVAGEGLIRGQMPLEEFFASDALVITGLVAAMIAIPIAIHNQGNDDEPASP